MRFSRLLIAAAVLAGLALPAGAQAAPRPAPLKAAAAAAERYWGTTPCAGQVSIVPRSRLQPGMHPHTDAWARFSSTWGWNNLGAPADTYRNCAIMLARWRWPTAASMNEDWDLLCATVIHETGHLLGHEHDSRRGSIMVPVFHDATSIPSVCRKMRPRAARRR